jgi:diacylglycerol kinase family enzyme
MTMLFPSVMSAKHVSLKEVHFINCKKVEIDFEGPQLINIDGNLHEMRGPLVYEIMPGALKVLC